jgi:hypothetical protein
LLAVLKLFGGGFEGLKTRGQRKGKGELLRLVTGRRSPLPPPARAPAVGKKTRRRSVLQGTALEEG